MSSADPVGSSRREWEPVTDLWLVRLCLGWSLLSNRPHVLALCAASETGFPWCYLCFCVKGGEACGTLIAVVIIIQYIRVFGESSS